MPVIGDCLNEFSRPYSPPLLARKLRSGHETHISAMTIRTRKFFGTIFLLILVVVWSLLGMTVAQLPWLKSSGLAQAIFYVVAGIGWGAAGHADRELDVTAGRLVASSGTSGFQPHAGKI